MNIVYPEENPIIATTCGCKERNRQKMTYAFSEDFPSLCIEKKYIIEAKIEACESLLKCAIPSSQRVVIERETAKLKAVLDSTP
jgi:hypothetical protein